MSFRLLVWLKFLLFVRSFSRRGPLGTIGFVALAALTAPIWLGIAAASHAAVDRHGAPALYAIFATVQLSWLYIALILGSFAEAFDLRSLLRYPVRPRVVHALNVLATPFDIVALFVLPPLAAAALAAGQMGGTLALAAAGVAAVLAVLITASLIQALLALLADLLKHEWARAAGGLLVGAAIFGASWALRNQALAGAEVAAAPPLLIDALVKSTGEAARLLPTSSLPASLAAAALEGRWVEAAGWTAASLLLLAVLALGGGHFAVRAALEREIRAGASRFLTASPAEGGGVARAFRFLLPADLATLVEREIRYLVRTPQTLIGLAITPLVVALFFGTRGAIPSLANGAPLWIYCAAFLTLTPALNLSANQLGLDREGVRLYFILPLPADRLLLAKNLALILVIAAEAALNALVLWLVGFPLRGPHAWGALIATFAALPAILAVGNELSVRSPWRMTFRTGGAPKGAIGSAFAQSFVLGAIALLLAIPALALDTPVWGLLGEAALAWWAWARLRKHSARLLVDRRERIIDALARPEETG